MVSSFNDSDDKEHSVEAFNQFLSMLNHGSDDDDDDDDDDDESEHCGCCGKRETWTLEQATELARVYFEHGKPNNEAFKPGDIVTWKKGLLVFPRTCEGEYCFVADIDENHKHECNEGHCAFRGMSTDVCLVIVHPGNVIAHTWASSRWLKYAGSIFDGKA